MNIGYKTLNIAEQQVKKQKKKYFSKQCVIVYCGFVTANCDF